MAGPALFPSRWAKLQADPADYSLLYCFERRSHRQPRAAAGGSASLGEPRMALNGQTDTLRSIGNCDLVEKIADRGMAVVYKGRDRSTGQVVAVKVLPPFQAGKHAYHRFARECRILSALNDPHIVRALDFGLEANSPYLVMEFVEGESLGERLAREGSLPEAEAVRLLVQVAGALGRAHQRGLVHRNVKPDNILITHDG